MRREKSTHTSAQNGAPLCAPEGSLETPNFIDGLVCGRGSLFLPQLLDFVLKQQFFSLQLDQFQIVGCGMRLFDQNGLIDGLMATLQLHEMRL
jgi:hypothetical protein